MNKQIFKIIFPALAILLFAKCAQVAPLNGGKRDIDPPKLLEAIPANRTINFNSDPLYVVDGVPTGSFYSIAPADVESMDIENLIYVMINDEYYEIEYARDFESMVATAHLIMDINPEVFHPYSIL